ncbi:MAG TPA: hypothetical protein VE289_00765, partial [Gaiellaceae bacterium]|nr:hypothetical protein [Gaiellaceae bacterium]
MRRPEQTIDLGAERLSAKLAESTTRRSFLGRLGAAALAVAGGSAVAAAVKPDESTTRPRLSMRLPLFGWSGYPCRSTRESGG